MNMLARAQRVAIAIALWSCGAAIAAPDVKYGGICDASAAVALDARRFIVADDNQNILLIHDRTAPANAPQRITLSSLFPGEIKDGKEIDVEGAAVLGTRIFWIGSHGTNKDAEPKAARQRLFAISVAPGADGKFVAARAGKIYTSLLTDLENDAQFKKYHIGAASKIAPKDIGGLSIEGLAASQQGSLLIGFRNPLIGGTVKHGVLTGGKALLVTLLNPLEVIDGKQARFGKPTELDLGGYGIRSIESRTKDQYLIVAGPYHANEAAPGRPREPSRLYLWSGKTPVPLDIDLGDLNVEAAFFYPGDTAQVQLLSDDGKNCNGAFRSRLERIEAR